MPALDRPPSLPASIVNLINGDLDAALSSSVTWFKIATVSDQILISAQCDESTELIALAFREDTQLCFHATHGQFNREQQGFVDDDFTPLPGLIGQSFHHCLEWLVCGRNFRDFTLNKMVLTDPLVELLFSLFYGRLTRITVSNCDCDGVTTENLSRLLMQSGHVSLVLRANSLSFSHEFLFRLSVAPLTHVEIMGHVLDESQLALLAAIPHLAIRGTSMSHRLFHQLQRDMNVNHLHPSLVVENVEDIDDNDTLVVD